MLLISVVNGRGAGTYEESNWGSFPAQVEITIEQTSTSLSTRDCWSFIANDAPQNLCFSNQFEVIGGELQIRGVNVGEIGDKGIDLSFANGPKKIEVHFSNEPDQTANFSYVLSALDRMTKASATGLHR
jgi:hypothetical protein